MYFDYAAAVPVSDEILEVYTKSQKTAWANPSSTHRLGQKAQAQLQQARSKVADILGCKRSQIVFAPSATVVNNIVIQCCLKKFTVTNEQSEAIISNITHKAIYDIQPFNGTLVVVKADQSGQVTWEIIEKSITQHTRIISLLHVNNELGTINDILYIASNLKVLNTWRKKQILLHVDGVQVPFYTKLKPFIEVVDYYVVSGHKLGAPRGCAILYIRDIKTIKPILFGGGQENGLIPGTENIPAICATAEALDYAQKNVRETYHAVSQLNAYTRLQLLQKCPQIQITNKRGVSQPSHLHFFIPNIDQDYLLSALDLVNVQVSAGSACYSGAHTISHVVLNMNLPTNGAYVRLSLHRNSTQSECDMFIENLAEIIARYNHNI
jgi:cysteine desulfurase